MIAHKENLPPPKFRLPPFVELAVIASLACASVIGNILITRFYWHLDISDRMELVLSGCIGLLIAQASLPAVWCGFGRGWLLGRIAPVCIFLILLMSYILTIGFLDGEFPVLIAVVFVVVSLVLFGIIQIPLWFIRWRNGISLTRNTRLAKRESPPQFSVRQLFIVTSVAAAITAMARMFANLFAARSVEFFQPLDEVFYFFTVFVVFVSILCLLTTAVVFSDRSRMALSVLLVFVWIAGTAAATWGIQLGGLFVVPRDDLSKVYGNVLMFSGTFVSAMLVVLMVFYALGYRIRSHAGNGHTGITD